MNKREALARLKEEMVADKALPLATNLVFGEGNPDAEVLFIGEAPGENEDIQKRPFVGRAGQLLRKSIRALGWKEEEVYITNIVKRRPPDNRDPSPEEIKAYEPYLTRQIGIISPPLIVALGRFSMNYFLPEAKITRDQGKVFAAGKWRVVPLFHPAAALRAPAMMEEFEASFKKLPSILKKLDPEPLVSSEEKKSQAQKPDQSRLF